MGCIAHRRQVGRWKKGRTDVEWHLSHRADPEARVLADRHYSRQSPDSPQFVPPGRCLVLKCVGAYWVTSAPYAQFVRHSWPGAWMCSAFRREPACTTVASVLILQAVAATRWAMGATSGTPPEGMVTFVDAGKVRHKRDPGRCFLRAGFHRVGETKGGLLAFQLLPEDMPLPCAPLGAERLQWETLPMSLEEAAG